MGFGRLLHRNIVITQQDTVTGEKLMDTVVTGQAAYPDWLRQRAGYDGGMGHPGAWRAALLLSDLIGGLPWHAYSDGPGGVPIRRTPTPPLLDRPAGRDTRMTTFSSWALDLIWHGNAVGLITGRDQFGEPVAALPVPATKVGVKLIEASDGVTSIPVGAPGYLIAGKWYRSEDVLHVKGPCEPGSVRGMGVLENHLRTLTLADEQDKQAGTATGAGIPLGTLKFDNPDVEPDEMRDAKTAWISAQAARTIAALGPGVTFEPLAWNPTEAQLLEARRFTLQLIALIFGVPTRYLGAENSSRTYSNVEQEGTELVRFGSVAGHLARFEHTLAAHLVPGTTVRANLDGLLRADTLGRYQAHQIGITAGFIAPSEARAFENRPPFTPEQQAEMKALKPPPPPALPPPGPPAGKPNDDPKEGAK